jgi:hypothetical protein
MRIETGINLSDVADQFLFGKKLQRAVTVHVDGVAKVAVRGGEDRNDDAVLAVVSHLFNPFANRKFGHRFIPLGNLLSDSPANGLTVLKQRPDQTNGGD